MGYTSKGSRRKASQMLRSGYTKATRQVGGMLMNQAKKDKPRKKKP